MAMILKLMTSDGSEATLDLADGVNTGVLSYVPKPPTSGAESVTESAKINIFGVPQTYTHRERLAMISRMFNLARARRSSGKGPRVYLQVEATTLATAYRSEIFDGVAPDLDEATFGELYAASEYIFTVAWTRAPFFEGSETQIGLTNNSATATTSAIVINNSDDTSRDNWFNIPTSELLSNTSGDIETPIKLEITNTTGSGVSASAASKLMIGMVKTNKFASNRLPMFEGESGTVGASITASNGSTTTAASNSAYKIVSWDGTARTLLSWTLAGADLTRMQGLRYIPIVRFASAPPNSDIEFLWQITLGATAVPQSRGGGWVRNTGTSYLQLGGGEIPPYLSDISSLYNMTFALQGRRAGGSVTSLLIDSVHLFPADKAHGGFRTLTPNGTGLAENEKLIDNGIDGQLYSDNTVNGEGIYVRYYADGDPLTIRPNSNNQFYIFQTGDAGDALATRTVTVKAYYRPRRATL